MSGQWPPEWDEPDWDDRDQEDTVADSDAADEGHPESAAVSAALAALPMPALPDAVEARITMALAAEAAARATGTAAVTEPTAAHTLDTSQPRSPAPRRRKRRFRPVMTVAPAVAALLIGGFAYLLTLGGGSSSSSGTALPPASASGPMPAAEPAQGSNARRLPADDLRPLASGERPVFVVTATGTRYQQATLVPQLRQALAATHTSANAATAPAAGQPVTASPAPSPATGFSSESAASSAQGAFAPSKTLAGCVLKVTGNAVPTLVEYATYQGKPAYVIVLSDRAWIVGTGCTASDPRVIASVSLAG